MAYINRVNSGIIPDKLHIVREGKSEDEIIGHIVPVIKDGTYGSKLASARRKIYASWALEEIEIDNTPQSGYSFMNIARRYSTQNTFWRIVTPQNFETEISSENLFHLINNCTIEDGLIKSEVVWIKTSSGMWLTSTDTDDYKQSVPEVQHSAKVSLRDCKPGYKIKVRGDKAEYTYLGSLHFASLCIVSNFYHQNKTSIDYDRYYIREKADGSLIFDKSLIVTSITDKSNIVKSDDVCTRCQTLFNSRNTIISTKPLSKNIYDYDYSLEEIQLQDIKLEDNFRTPLRKISDNILVEAKGAFWIITSPYPNKATGKFDSASATGIHDINLADGKLVIDHIVVSINASGYYNRFKYSSLDVSSIQKAFAITWKKK